MKRSRSSPVCLMAASSRSRSRPRSSASISKAIRPASSEKISKLSSLSAAGSGSSAQRVPKNVPSRRLSGTAM